MLSYLRIRDLALIEDVAIEPPVGLVAFTGETGAGKSIILDGLSLAVGHRAALDQIRTGAESATVEALFDITDRPDIVELLEREELATSSPEVLVRRVIGSRSSRAYVNDRLVTVGLVHKMGVRLVDIAGQHESQFLLAAATQLELLDRFGDLLAQRSMVANAWDGALELQRRLQALETDDRDRAQRADYLRYRAQEIRAADLHVDEEATLSAERQRLRNAEDLSAATTEALEVLYEREESAAALVRRAQRAVERIARLDAGAPASSGELAEAGYAIEEITRSLQAYLDLVQVDPTRLDAVEARLATVDGLRRKYGDRVEDIVRVAEDAERELASLENRDQEIAELASQVRQAVRAFDEAAAILSTRRADVAPRLSRHITSELQELGMEGARFEVRLKPGGASDESGFPTGASRRGYEAVEFRLAANPGDVSRELARTASGGELSRVMLALKLTETREARPQTLVFDEIDSGVGGGRVADRLAARLAELGTRHQVLVITHLPQIAARATTHYRVRKAERDGRMCVAAAVLDVEQRVDELARMLGGIGESRGVREHARDLLGQPAC